MESIREQRNKLAQGECEPQLALDIMYNEAVKERKDAVERCINLILVLKFLFPPFLKEAVKRICSNIKGFTISGHDLLDCLNIRITGKNMALSSIWR